MTVWIQRGDTGLLLQRLTYRNSFQQALYSTIVASDFRSNGCNVLFDSDQSVWEWYSGIGTCNKLYEGLSMKPTWFSSWSFNDTFASTNEYTQETRVVNHFCDTKETGACYGEDVDNGTPFVHSHDRDPSAGFSWYDAFRKEPSPRHIRKPKSCGDQNRPPLYNQTDFDLALTCKRAWTTTWIP